MRDILLAVILAVAIPAIVVRPYLGIYFWYWIAFMNPHRLVYGFMYGFPAASYVAIAALIGLLFTKDKWSPPAVAINVSLFSFAVFITLTTYLSQFPDSAWLRWQDVMKSLLMTFVTTMLINERRKVRAVLMTAVLSLGYFSIKGAIWGIATAAQYRLYGPMRSALGDNNALGLALNMAIPLALFLWKHEQNKWLKRLFLFVLVCDVFGVALTYSRGALIGFGVVIACIALQKRQRTAAAVVVLILLVGAISFLMPETWYQRMGTIKEYEGEESAESRLETWRWTWNFAQDHPLTGGGFEAFRANPHGFNAHSIYFGTLGEHGFVGLGLFALILLVSQRVLGRIAGLPTEDPELRWFVDCARALRVALIAYTVSGAFLNLQYFELMYVMLAMAVGMQEILRRGGQWGPLRRSRPAPEPAVAVRPPARWKDRPGEIPT